jgi:peptide/nickel transport system permease protein
VKPPAELLTAGVGWTSDFRARHRRAMNLAKRPSSLVAIIGVTVLLVVAIFGHLLAPFDPAGINLPAQFQAPNTSHLLGTDELGRDVFSRVMAGASYSVLSAASVLVIALVVGTIVGSIAGYFGRVFDEVLMRITDVFLAFPALILALAISVTLGGGVRGAIIAIGAVWWPGYARLVRGQVLNTKSNDYVDAARALGVGRLRILRVHVLRNCMTPVLVQLTLDVGNVLVTFAGLSYLGVGAPPGSPEWGATISDGQAYILTSWWIATFPGLALYLSALVLNLFGEFLGDVLMPSRSVKMGRTSRRHARRRNLLRIATMKRADIGKVEG